MPPASSLVLVLGCAWALGCTVRERRPDGPYRQAQEFTDALSDEAVACTRAGAPAGRGWVVVAAEFTGPGLPPRVYDAGSMAGSEALLACVRKRATETLRCPPSAPARFVYIRVPVPLVTSEVRYAFTADPPGVPAPAPP